MIMSEYDYEIVYRPGKIDGNADALSRMMAEPLIELDQEDGDIRQR